jgi:hypothetical protein
LERKAQENSLAVVAQYGVQYRTAKDYHGSCSKCRLNLHHFLFANENVKAMTNKKAIAAIPLSKKSQANEDVFVCACFDWLDNQ